MRDWLGSDLWWRRPRRLVQWLLFWYLLAVGVSVTYSFGWFQPKSGADAAADALEAAVAADPVAPGTAANRTPSDASAKTLKPSPLGGVLAVVVVLGALGAVVTATFKLVHEEDLSRSIPPERACWYAFAPFKGMLLSGFFFVALRAGLLAMMPSETMAEGKIHNANVYFFAAIACGLFSDSAYTKLRQISESVFGLKEDRASTQQQERKPLSPEEPGARDIVVTPAVDMDDKVEVYRFRYKVLVESEGWRMTSADAEARVVRDDYDRYAYILRALFGPEQQMAGTIRSVLWTNLGRELRVRQDSGVEAPKSLVAILQTGGLSFPSAVGSARNCYTSRLLVSKANTFGKYVLTPKDEVEVDSRAGRHHTVTTALCCALFTYALTIGVQLDWITCTDRELRFYEKLGYRRFAGGLRNPEFAQSSEQATCNVMYLIVDDHDHLVRVNSPLAWYRRVNEVPEEEVAQLRSQLASVTRQADGA